MKKITALFLALAFALTGCAATAPAPDAGRMPVAGAYGQPVSGAFGQPLGTDAQPQHAPSPASNGTGADGAPL